MSLWCVVVENKWQFSFVVTNHWQYIFFLTNYENETVGDWGDVLCGVFVAGTWSNKNSSSLVQCCVRIGGIVL